MNYYDLTEEQKSMAARYGEDVAKYFNERSEDEKRAQFAAQKLAAGRQDIDAKLQAMKEECLKGLIPAIRRFMIGLEIGHEKGILEFANSREIAYTFCRKAVDDFFYPDDNRDKAMTKLYSQIKDENEQKEREYRQKMEELTK